MNERGSDWLADMLERLAKRVREGYCAHVAVTFPPPREESLVDVYEIELHLARDAEAAQRLATLRYEKGGF